MTTPRQAVPTGKDFWLEMLSPCREQILRLRIQNKTLKEIGAMFGVSPERVRQIEGNALLQLWVLKALIPEPLNLNQERSIQ